MTDRGFIQTDFQRRTDEPNIFAIGDVAGEPMLAHKASHEARVAVEAIAGHKAIFEPQAIPAVVFTDPEIAWAGLTETQAEKEGRKVEVAQVPVGRLGPRDRDRSRRRADEAADRSRRPSACSASGIVGSGAGELIAEGVLAIEMGATASDVKLTIHPHPTLIGDDDGSGGAVLRHGHARLQAETEIGPLRGRPLAEGHSWRAAARKASSRSFAADSPAANGHARTLDERVRRVQNRRLSVGDAAQNLPVALVPLSKLNRAVARARPSSIAKTAQPSPCRNSAPTGTFNTSAACQMTMRTSTR